MYCSFALGHQHVLRFVSVNDSKSLYNTVYYIMILNIKFQLQMQDINQHIDSQKTLHSSPSQASYGVSFVGILEKNDHVIKMFDCFFSHQI